MVEPHTERLKIEILLLSQLAHRELTHRHPVCLSNVSLGQLADVLAVVTTFRNVRGSAPQLIEPGFDARGEILDLSAGVVVVELPGDRPTGEFKQGGDRVAESGLTTVSDMQRTSGIRRDELDVHDARRADRVAAVLLIRHDDVAQAGRNFPGVDPEIHESWTSDLYLGDTGVFESHRAAQALGYFAWPRPQRFGKHHCEVRGQIAVRRFTGTFEQRIDVGGRADAARRPNQLGADLISSSHSFFLIFLSDVCFSTRLGAAGFAPFAFGSGGGGSGLGRSVFRPGSAW